MATKRKGLPISAHTQKCIGDLRADFTDRRYGKLGSQARGSIELGFLRGYQAGYEDCMMKRPPEHYVRSKKEIREYEKDAD